MYFDLANKFELDTLEAPRTIRVDLAEKFKLKPPDAIVRVLKSNQPASVVDSMQIRALDSDFNVITIVDSYDSFIWTEWYNKVGDFELYGTDNDQIKTILNDATYLFNSITKNLMVLERPSIENTEDGTSVTLVGRGITSVLDRRVLKNTITLFNPVDVRVSQIVCDLISDAFGPSDQSRHWDRLEVENATGINTAVLRDDTPLELTIGTNLLSLVSDLCVSAAIGIRCEFISSTKKVKFIVYDGVDRTSYGKDFVMFSDLNDNLNTSQETVSFETVKNAVLVVGNVVDSDTQLPSFPQFVLGEDAQGLERRETYLKTDQNDIFYREDGTEQTMSPVDYVAALKQAGLNELTKPDYKPVRNYEGEIVELQNCAYGKQFALGDRVVFRALAAAASTARLDGVIFSDDAKEGKTLAPKFSYE